MSNRLLDRIAMPAVVRQRLDRVRHAMDDAAFRNCVKMGIDASAALTALGTVSGRLRMPEPSDIVILTARSTIAASNLWLDGANTLIYPNATNAGLDFTGIDSGITRAKILGCVTTLPTAGAAITFVGGQKCFATDIRMEKVFNGIDLSVNSETILDNIHIRDIHGTFGIKSGGSSAPNGVYGARLSQITCDTPYTVSADATSWKGARVASTAYTAGDIYTSNGCVYQVTTGGTSAVGTGPNGSHGTFATRLITDGTAVVQFMYSTAHAWVLVDSFAYTMSIRGAALLDGGYGVRVTDSLATGSSYPAWVTLNEVECDHSGFASASVEAGRYFKAGGASWFGSCLSGNGVVIGSSYVGGGGVSESEVNGNAQHGVLLNAANGFIVHNNDIGSNSQASSATYNNVTVGANINGFEITSNRFMPDLPATSQASGRPVVVSAGTSDGYIIRNNTAKGHATANTVNDGGSGVSKFVENPVVVP